MRLSFDVAGTPAEFHRNPWTSRVDLRVGDDTVCLQNPLRFSTQFTFRTRDEWRHRVGEHDVEIVKIRPRLLGGLRPHSFTFSVDGAEVAAATGY